MDVTYGIKSVATFLFLIISVFQAFMELQGKMQETNQKLRIADVQVESLKKQIVHAQLTDKEIQVNKRTFEIVHVIPGN